MKTSGNALAFEPETSLVMTIPYVPARVPAGTLSKNTIDGLEAERVIVYVASALTSGVLVESTIVAIPLMVGGFAVGRTYGVFFNVSKRRTSTKM